jgi:TPR repeat protein
MNQWNAWISWVAPIIMLSCVGAPLDSMVTPPHTEATEHATLEGCIELIEKSQIDDALLCLQPLDEEGVFEATLMIAGLETRTLTPENVNDTDVWQAAVLKETHPTVLLYLGLKYTEGIGVPRDNDKALRNFKLAAEKGERRANWILASAYLTGKGPIKVAEDPVVGIDYLKRAAELGVKDAESTLAVAYRKGSLGLPKDDEMVVKWATRAAEKGEPTAMALLGDCYASGRGVPRDVEQALMWLKGAAIGGNVQSQFILGQFYESGTVLPQDLDKALKWFKSAAENGHPEAKIYVEKLSAPGSPE